MMTETHPAMLEERIRELEHENARLKHDAYLYKDSYTASMLDLTASAQNLARQEAKTVEYRAAWIKATKERDEYARRLRDAKGLADDWTNSAMQLDIEAIGFDGIVNLSSRGATLDCVDDLRKVLEVTE